MLDFKNMKIMGATPILPASLNPPEIIKKMDTYIEKPIEKSGKKTKEKKITKKEQKISDKEEREKMLDKLIEQINEKEINEDGEETEKYVLNKKESVERIIDFLEEYYINEKKELKV